MAPSSGPLQELHLQALSAVKNTDETEVPEAFGADGDDEVGFVQLPAEPRHLALPAHLQVLPEVQHNLSSSEAEIYI